MYHCTFCICPIVFLLYRTIEYYGDGRVPRLTPLKKSNVFEPSKEAEEMDSTVVHSGGLSILMVGRTGMGKSTLINGLIGRDEERRKKKDSLFSVEDLNIDGVLLTLMFWNSPKLQDADSSDIKQKVKEVDLIMYTLRMDDSRVRPQDSSILRTLSRLFGQNFWSKAMFVLTFANRVKFLDENHIPQRTKEHLNRKTLQWQKFIHESLSEEGIYVRDIPIVPVGHYSELKMFEDEEDWTVLFVNSMLERLRKAVRPALIKICKYCHHLYV